jgi:hypothetical protein
VPGLNSTNIDWNTSWVKWYIGEMLDVYKNATNSNPAPNAYYIPYQITLHVLQALYFQFEPAMEGTRGNEQEIIAKLRRGEITSKNPENREAALRTSLRAIAYFSWEPESRLFLVRRVYPSYFDFLSVSHIPEGWGVSSIMLRDLQNEFRNGLTNGFFVPVKVNHADNLRYMLPYLAEQRRLSYKHVLLLPVFKRDLPESDRDMLGTVLFFIADESGMPTVGSLQQLQFSVFAKCFCDSFADLIKIHNKAQIRGSSLANEWRSTREGSQVDARIAKVVLRCDRDHIHNGDMCPKLEDAAREFLKALTIPNY